MADRLLSLPFVLGFVAYSLHSLVFFSYLHLPGHLEALGADEVQIGWAMGGASAAGVAIRPWVGRAVDTRGRRFVALVGSGLHIVVAAGYLAVDSFGPLLFVVRLGHGLSIALLFTTFFTIAADVVPPARRTEGIALFGLSGMLPMSLGGLLGDFVLARGTYQDLFMVCLVAAVIAGLVALPMPDSRPAGELPSQRSFLRAVWTPKLRPLWLAGLGFALLVASYFTFIKTFVLRSGVGSVGSFFTAYTVAAVVLRVGAGWVPDRFGPRRTVVPAFAMVVAGVVTLAWATSDLMVIVAGIICGIGHAYVFPIFSVLVVQRARAEERGSGLAMFTALFDLGLLVGGPLYGLVLDATGHEVMFTVAAGLGGLCLVLWLPWDLRACPASPSPAGSEASAGHSRSSE